MARATTEVVEISSAAMAPRPAPARRESRRLLRLKEGAEYLGVSRDTLRAIIWRGELPVVRYNEHAPFLLDIRDLDRWVEEHKTRF